MSAYLVTVVVNSPNSETAKRIAESVAELAATAAEIDGDGDYAETFVSEPVEVVRD